MTLLLAAASGGIGDTITDTAKVFGWHPWTFLSQCFSFTVVCILLYKFAYQPILTVLELRRNKIEQGLADALKSKQELAATERRTAELLAKANAEGQKMIEDARAAAKLVLERESQRAIAEAEGIIAKAHEATRQTHDKMLIELRREVARLVVDTTSRVTGKVLTSDDQRRLSEDASREMAA